MGSGRPSLEGCRTSPTSHRHGTHSRLRTRSAGQALGAPGKAIREARISRHVDADTEVSAPQKNFADVPFNRPKFQQLLQKIIQQPQRWR
ncbi:hypothetical protein GCM10010336_70610 [Streptomyces goshikiensis]|nr:hypothetical protein GCM10010336_70610 [Streptomyces goshikiensis]